MVKPSDTACRAAVRLGRTLSSALDDEALTPAGYRLLAYLNTGGAAATMLAEKLAISRPSVTVTTDWLESRGFVTRASDPEDGRRVRIEISKDGREALRRADLRLASRFGQILDLLDDEQARSVVLAMEHIAAALDRDRELRHERAIAANRPRTANEQSIPRR
jgi:DNA-binding MarR family transcriptional regulator